MLNIFYQGLNGGSAVSVVPCNDVVHRIGFRFSWLWAHVLNLRFRATNLPCHELARAPAPVNQSGIRSAIWPCETSRRGFAMLPLSSSTVTA